MHISLAKAVTIDGGPHTLWWPAHIPDIPSQEHFPPPAPPPQILRELFSSARIKDRHRARNPLFIITLKDPVTRLYSEYHFVGMDEKARHIYYHSL